VAAHGRTIDTANPGKTKREPIRWEWPDEDEPEWNSPP